MLETLSFSSFLVSLIIEKRVRELKKMKNRRSVFLIFQILATLISRIKNLISRIKKLKNGASDFFLLF